MKKFNKGQNKVLTEIYRRLNWLDKTNLDTNLLLLTIPSEAKKIENLGLIKPFSTEQPRVYSWYNLTEKGKKFFSNYLLTQKLFSPQGQEFHPNLLAHQNQAEK